MEEFSTEEQLEFWELSAEHVSRKKVPSFSDIVTWMDLLYKAPVHFVYKIEDGKLILDRRHVITKNILKTNTSEKEPHKETPQEKEFIRDFEYQLQNLEKKMSIDDVFKEHGITSHSIGQCEHIPLFNSEGELWGIYCAGPYTKSPEQIAPKLSIVGRMLSRWLISLDEEESNPQKDYDSKIRSIFADLGSGKLNTEGISDVVLRYIVHGLNAEKGVVVEFNERGHQLISSFGMDEKISELFTATADKRVYENIDGKLKPTDFGSSLLEDLGDGLITNYFEYSNCSGFLLVVKKDKNPSYNISDLLDELGILLAQLLNYRQLNVEFSNHLMETYYQMLRTVEKSRDKTTFHTPRMMAFVQRFGMFFGLEDDEMEIIIQTAKLHDIGYVGAVSLESGKSIGGEITHPVIGSNLIEELAVDRDVIEGIKTHHEWVNGNGTPDGLIGDSIPWTGKIIGMFEYIIDFIETNQNDSSKTEDEWMELLVKGLMERADVQFDMVLIPTAIQLLQALGWDTCVNLGTD